ncbi:MAG TPA: redoxin family protein [Gemmataceae bacterium]
MRPTWSFVAILAFAATAPAAEPLAVGDPAPPLRVKEFVQGDPVPALEKGTVYVVEFWATWCAPCRAAAPHLAHLQKQYPAVVVIGVSVAEEDFRKVRFFVDRMGGKMDYRVATDDVPAGKTADDGAMTRTWRAASGQDGLPTAFVVGKDGRIAWVGEPSQMDAPLADVVAGRWDVDAAAARYKEDKARERKVLAAIAKIKRAAGDGDLRSIIAVVDEAVHGDPAAERLLGRIKFEAVWELGGGEKAAAYGRTLIDGPLKDDAQRLRQLAWFVVAPQRLEQKPPDPAVLRLALDAAARANDIQKGEDADVLAALAQAHFLSGDVAKAVELGEAAAKMQPDDRELRRLLAAYRQAKARGKE